MQLLLQNTYHACKHVFFYGFYFSHPQQNGHLLACGINPGDILCILQEDVMQKHQLIRNKVSSYYIEGHISLLDRANMNQFIGHHSQIEFFVSFKADRILKYLQYDPYVYHAFNFFCFFGFTADNGGSQKTERIGNT